MFGLSPSIIGLLKWVLDFTLSKRDFVDLFVDKVGENCNSFTIISINNELTTARVLVEGDKGPPIRLCHYVKLLLDYVDVRGLYGVRVPHIVGVNDEFGRNLVKEPMWLMVLIHVALHIWPFLKVEVCIGGRGLSAIYLSLSDHLASFGRSRHLYGFEIVQSDITFWLPLAQILVKAVVVACHVVEENAVWLQVVQYLRSLILINSRQKSTLFVAVYHVQLLFPDGAEVNEELHSEAAGEERLARRFAHLKKKLDTVVLALPGQHAGIALDHHYVDQVKSFLVMLAIGRWVEFEQMVVDADAIARINFRNALLLRPSEDFFQELDLVRYSFVLSFGFGRSKVYV